MRIGGSQLDGLSGENESDWDAGKMGDGKLKVEQTQRPVVRP